MTTSARPTTQVGRGRMAAAGACKRVTRVHRVASPSASALTPSLPARPQTAAVVKRCSTRASS